MKEHSTIKIVEALKGSRFVVVGGASMVGSHITKALLASDAKEVTVVDNFSLGSLDQLNEVLHDDRLKVAKADILRLSELYDAIGNADGLFMTAAYLTIPLAANPGLGLDVNVQGLKNVLDLCRFRRISRVVFSSSIAVYGNAHGEIDEETPLQSTGLSPAFMLYACTKLLGENLLRLYQERFEIGFAALRYSTIYGEGQHDRGVNSLRLKEAYEVLQRGDRPEIGGDLGVHDYLHVADVTHANLLAMSKTDTSGSFNIATGRALTEEAVITSLIRIGGFDVSPQRIDGNAPGLAQSARELVIKSERAAESLGWSPTIDIDEGLKRLVAWWRSSPRKN
jgi:UDP-glucose 4-epimerase